MSRETSLEQTGVLTRQISYQTSKWANRFMIAAVFQGALAAALTSFLLYEGVFGHPEASRIVAAGGAGTWLTVGYLAYIPLGPIAAAVTALFYRHLETYLQKPYGRWIGSLAWLHLVLMNVGVVGATWLMMNARVQRWRSGHEHSLRRSRMEPTPGPLEHNGVLSTLHCRLHRHSTSGRYSGRTGLRRRMETLN